jgi:signal transduction histidine kinase
VLAQTWRVNVRDHGIGIDPHQVDRLFQFFSRLQARERYEGTGMGLALCRRIVEHHGGRIWAESEGEGKGSVFIFELPLGDDAGKD